MTAATACDVGLRCPDCWIRTLVSWWKPRHYRCECCNRVYRFSLDAMKGIVLTLTDERAIRRMDALPRAEQHHERRLELVKLEGNR